MKHTNQHTTAAGARARRVVTNSRKAVNAGLRSISGLWPTMPCLSAFGDAETPFYVNLVRPSDRSLNRSKPEVPLLQRSCPT